ncbi:MAG: ATP-binding protein [Chloroflexi bacterium]|nr:ATP-binding protein [Chloroflexota bacterium]
MRISGTTYTSLPGTWGISRFRISAPLAYGIAAIMLVALAILFIGETQINGAVLQKAGDEHADDLLRFSQSIHYYSGLSLGGPEARENLTAVVRTSAFDAEVKRALFGIRARRMDIYSLNGDPLYSTEGLFAAPALSGGALTAFENARRGISTSYFREGTEVLDGEGTGGQFVQSFALVLGVPPDSTAIGRSLMVVAITSNVSAEITAAHSTVWLVVGIFALGSMLILSVVHWVSVRSRSRLQVANDALAEQYIAVRESRERMIAASDTTKRAIAEELHGSVQTRLFSLWMQLSQLKNQAEKHDGTVDTAELGRITDEIDDVRENDIRGLSHRLHPSIVRVGALPALTSLCDRMSGDMKIVLHADDRTTSFEPAGASTIPENIRLAVFRIAELAIGNAVKHASAKQCDVHWSYSDTEQALLLRISDDGIGFNPETMKTSGLGMVNIQDYTDALGGTAELHSEPGRGTMLIVTIPFTAPAASSRLRQPRPVRNTTSNITPFDQQQKAA